MARTGSQAPRYPRSFSGRAARHDVRAGDYTETGGASHGIAVSEVDGKRDTRVRAGNPKEGRDAD
jgi:hypothetical protein